MKSNRTEGLASFFLTIIALYISISFVYTFFFSNDIGDDIEATKAKPIYQQKIGDDINPDILIIYEAEVDGVKVYPSVVKESE